MLKLEFASRRGPLRVLCIGAHSDDLEIGCGGTLLEWQKPPRKMEATWVVLSADGRRVAEMQKSARGLLGNSTASIIAGEFRDGFLPAQYRELKTFFERLKGAVKPDVILTHRLEDRHQDHRLACELTWNTWRDHLVLEYEIPKYEGDLGHPNVYVPIAGGTAKRKVRHLMRHFATQRSRSWFTEDTFFGLMRLRGIECRAAAGLAEAYHARKLVL